MQNSVVMTAEDKIQQVTVSRLEGVRKRRMRNIRKTEQHDVEDADGFQRFDEAVLTRKVTKKNLSGIPLIYLTVTYCFLSAETLPLDLE